MKHLKTLSLAVAVAAALMTFVGAGTASATELECGETMCGAETTIHAVSSSIIWHPEIGDITCNSSTLTARTANTGTSTETVHGPITSLTWSGCNSEEIDTIAGGELIIHTDSNDTAGTSGNGTLTSVGLEWTQKLLGLHCIFGTGSGTDMGTITGSRTTGGTATLMIEARIQRVGGRSGIFCGGTMEMTGSYTFDSPMTLNVK